jgi:hypothetical protein
MLTFTFADADALPPMTRRSRSAGREPLAVHVDLGVVAMHVHHRALETERADGDAYARLDWRVLFVRAGGACVDDPGPFFSRPTTCSIADRASARAEPVSPVLIAAAARRAA